MIRIVIQLGLTPLTTVTSSKTKGKKLNPNWALLNNQSTVNILYNIRLLTNIWVVEGSIEIHCNTGIISTVKTELDVLSLRINTTSKGLYFIQSPWLRIQYRALDFVFVGRLNTRLYSFILYPIQIEI